MNNIAESRIGDSGEFFETKPSEVFKIFMIILMINFRGGATDCCDAR